MVRREGSGCGGGLYVGRAKERGLMEGVGPALRLNVPGTRRDYDAPTRQDSSCILTCLTYRTLLCTTLCHDHNISHFSSKA